ncbi:MAG TPA: hypothetical protein VKB96_11455 [Gammaproteobacteria bacterium]|nr:hypothetical protein [Gammaproteobacteria bacterium]
MSFDHCAPAGGYGCRNDMTAYFARHAAATDIGQPAIITNLVPTSAAVQDQRALTAAVIPISLGDERGVLIHLANASVAAPLVDALTRFMILASTRLHESRLPAVFKAANQSKDASQALHDSRFSTALVGLLFLDNVLRFI